MARWFSKRWVWAALAAATVTGGLAAGRGGEGDGPPKVGAVLSLNIDGKGERQFKVIKTEKQPDGSYLSDLKDTKTGETITLLDKPGDLPPMPPAAPTPPAAPKAPEPPKAKPRPNDPPQFPTTAADAPKDKDKEQRRGILNRIFGDKDKDKDKMPAMPNTASSSAAGPRADAAADSGKRQGILGRVFGPKKPSGPSMPATPSMPANPSPSAPPPIIPLPPGGLGGAAPAFPAPSVPNVMPSTRPGAAPAPLAPPPLAPPPSVSFPTPPPLPLPTPVSAPLPVPPAPGGGMLPIPAPPGGMSMTRPMQTVVQAGYVPANVAYDREVRPFVAALQATAAPSARLTAAQGLAGCRHCSSDGVKKVLFQAARMDPCGEVRAACITHLCKLGYFDAQFLGYIQTACEDTDPQVRDAARAACAKLIRQK